jgi:hypothetical protein
VDIDFSSPEPDSRLVMIYKEAQHEKQLIEAEISRVKGRNRQLKKEGKQTESTSQLQKDFKYWHDR